MGCGCKGARWQAPNTVSDARAAQRGQQSNVEPARTRELIPGGYWNGPKAKKKPAAK